MNKRLLRTFIAVTVPKELLHVRDMLKTTITYTKDNLRWVSNGQIHFTLKFIGHTPPEDLERIHDVLSQVADRHHSTDHLISGTGCFPTAVRPRILWVGITENIDPLQRLVQDINTSLDSLGYMLESQEFIPHITLARIKYPPKMTPDITRYLQAEFTPMPMKVERLSLFSSELTPRGPVYTKQNNYHLLPPKSQ
ncbi:MAG: RNA 2',3'-cyclic phosphodiesterase [Fidelibacterota bacterium]